MLESYVELAKGFFTEDMMQFVWPLYVLWVTHYVSGFAILYVLLDDRFAQYRLHTIDKEALKKATWYHLRSVTTDFFIVIPTFYFSALWYFQPQVPASWVWYLEIPKIVLAYTVGRTWAMTVHYVMHRVKFLYVNVHLKHHVKLSTLEPFGAWTDNFAEFILMEVPGSFLLGPITFGLHPISLALIWGWHGITASIDHCGLYIPDFLGGFIDGRYHFVHHKWPDTNYAEMEILDLLAGTWRDVSDKAPAGGEFDPIEPSAATTTPSAAPAVEDKKSK